MKQGLLAFQYEEEKSTTGMTALSGLMTYVELMHGTSPNPAPPLRLSRFPASRRTTGPGVSAGAFRVPAATAPAEFHEQK